VGSLTDLQLLVTAFLGMSKAWSQYQCCQPTWMSISKVQHLMPPAVLDVKAKIWPRHQPSMTSPSPKWGGAQHDITWNVIRKLFLLKSCHKVITPCWFQRERHSIANCGQMIMQCHGKTTPYRKQPSLFRNCLGIYFGLCNIKHIFSMPMSQNTVPRALRCE